MRIGGAREELADSSRRLPSPLARVLPRRLRAEQPALALQELVLTAHRSIDQHADRVSRARSRRRVVCRRHRDHAGAHARARRALGSLVARRDRAAARRTRSRQRALALRTAGGGGLAGGLRRAQHRRRSRRVGRIRIASRAGLRQLARCRQSERDGARGRGVARARRSFLDDAHDARRASRSKRRAAPSAAAPCCGSRTPAASSASWSIWSRRYEKLSTEVASLRALIEALPSPVWTRDAAGQLTFVNAAYARAVEAKNAADAVERGLELLDSAARENHRAGAQRRRQLFRPAARRRRRRAAHLRRARFSHRDRQRRHRHRRHRSGNDAQRARAPCRCASPHARPAFDRRRHVRRRSPADLLQCRLSRAVGPRRRLPRSGPDRFGGDRSACARRASCRRSRISGNGRRSCTRPIAPSKPRNIPGICPTDARCASSPRPIRTAASPICSTTSPSGSISSGGSRS